MTRDANMEKHEDSVLRSEVEDSDTSDHAGLDTSNQPQYHSKETRRILRKVDYRLIPLLTLL